MVTTREQTLNTLNYRESNITKKLYSLRMKCGMTYPNSRILILILTIHNLLINLSYTLRPDVKLL